MNGRVMKKEELVARLLADQELRRQRKALIIDQYYFEKKNRIEHKQCMRKKKGRKV